MSVDPSAVTEAGGATGVRTELAPGASVGKYRLDRVLGAGGMGVVWAAFDPDLERAVAIKVLRSVDSDPALRTRLLREARAMARLKHPNVLTVYEVGTDRNRDYIAMELIDGGDLDGWLAGKPPRDEVFAALLAAGRGIAAAHDASLVHRDLKPHNILRGRDGQVYVTDFGLARGQVDDAELAPAPLAATATAAPSQARALDSVLDSPLTRTGMLIGTPAYMAPEQFAGRAPDPRSDQFAFCVTAWEALTGERPFAGKTLDELRAAAGAGPRPDARLPARVHAVLARGMAPEPADRWPDMHVLLRELDAAIVPAPPRRSRVAMIAAASLGVVAVVAGAALLATERAGGSDVDSCGPASEAFGAAWSADRRRDVLARHRRARELLPISALFDGLRRDWIGQYDETCAMPSSPERHARLACLQAARNDIDEATRALMIDGSELSLMGVIPLEVALRGCRTR